MEVSEREGKGETLKKIHCCLTSLSEFLVLFFKTKVFSLFSCISV